MIGPYAIALFALAFALPAAASEEVYNIDPVHSQPMFEVQHMGFSVQRGSFGKATGKVTLERVAKKGTIDVTIDTTSIRTIDPRLDTHVKGEDFFNVAKYPTITFKSSNLTFDGDRVIGADGELTMIGVTKPVSLKVTSFACGDHPMNRKADVRRRSDCDDQALRMGNEVRHSKGSRRRCQDHHSGRGIPRIGRYRGPQRPCCRRSSKRLERRPKSTTSSLRSPRPSSR